MLLPHLHCRLASSRLGSCIAAGSAVPWLSWRRSVVLSTRWWSNRVGLTAEEASLLPATFLQEEVEKYESTLEETRKAFKKRKVAMVAGYVGTGYHGVQFNGSEFRTVESDIIRALYRSGCILPTNLQDLSKIGWSRSSRTDKNVHASSIVLSGKLLVPEEKIQTATGYISGLADTINEYLPSEIRVFSCTKTTQSFRAREACNTREYEYILPLDFFKKCMEQASRLNPGATSMSLEDRIHCFQETIHRFQGTHNFHNFTKVKKALYIDVINKMIQRQEEKSIGFPEQEAANHVETSRVPISSHFRTIYKCECSDVQRMRKDEVLVVSITGTSFLLHQIRYMIGSAIAVAGGLVTKTTFEAALDTNAIFKLPMVPAEGLLLLNCTFTRDIRSGSIKKKLNRYESMTPETVLLKNHDVHQVETFRKEVIYPHVLQAWKISDNIDEWVGRLEKLSEITHTQHDFAKATLTRMHEAKASKVKLHELYRKDNLNTEEMYENYRKILPQAFATSLAIHFDLPPGPKLADVQRSLVKSIYLGILPEKSDSETLMAFVKKYGIDNLASEGQKLRK